MWLGVRIVAHLRGRCTVAVSEIDCSQAEEEDLLSQFCLYRFQWRCQVIVFVPRR
jgi:hypothetical protein